MSINRRGRRGLSLAELLIAVFIAGIIMTIGANGIAYLLQNVTRGSDRAELQQQGLVAVSKMSADIESTCVNGISLLNPDGAASPVVLAVVPIDQTNAPDGYVTWQLQAVTYVYDAGAGTLTRRIFTPANLPPLGGVLQANAPQRIPAAVLALMGATHLNGEQLLARNVIRLTIGHGSNDPSLITLPLNLDVVLDKPPTNAQRDHTTFEITRAVASRNHV
jgi:prepilin-type N-terminal cleavage/methylation domain-containing protein